MTTALLQPVNAMSTALPADSEAFVVSEGATRGATPEPVVVHQFREAWLADAVERLRPWFTAIGCTVPAVRVSAGFASTGNAVHVGQCWPTTRSEDGLNHVFVSPVLQDPVAVLDTLVHELVHAVDDCEHKHGREYKKIALAIGLQGAMRSASAGKELTTRLQELALALGPYPHGKLSVVRRVSTRPPRPRARCEQCGYEVPMLKRFVSYGAPICPKDRIEMEQIGDWESAEGKAPRHSDQSS